MLEDNNTYSDNDIVGELEQCREDERSSQNQMIQVIMTAGAVLTLIFSASFESPEYLRVSFFLSSLVLCTALAYVTSLGISAVLRYHYIRDLEDKLLKGDGENGIIRWNSFASAITTRNLKHIHSIYTFMHYLSYSIAAICPILFCIGITFYQFCLIEGKSIIDKLMMSMSIIIMLLCLLIYFVISMRAGKMYEKAKEISLKRRDERLNKTGVYISTKREKIQRALKAIGYFIYPKKKDLQKATILVIGFLTGCLFRDGSLKETGNLCNMAVVWFVIDFLLYQARYQWNDIRGVEEDVLSKKTNRLPVDILGKRKAVLISSVLLTAKVIVAFVIVFHLESDMKSVLLVSAIIILVCAVLYEFVRSRESTGGIFLVVSFGYAIRFGVGMCSAYPEIWDQGFSFCNVTISRAIFIVLLISYALLGEYSVVLSWLQEVLMQKRDEIPINKKHYQYLYDRLVENCKGQEDVEGVSINQSSALYELWNYRIYVLSVYYCYCNLLQN
ncbi:MAG: hypothetical protein NC489_35355 [Ruminococcus flavefaciens]|nr:hypothetical protein [Ruminococcus flavefaciens]